jgi:septal ring factor EnvC (AmiA/AmiB activator)
LQTCDRRTQELDRKITESADEADGRIRELEAEVKELKREKRNYQNTRQKLNHRIASLEEGNARLLEELEAAKQQGLSVIKERNENEKQLKALKDNLEETKQFLHAAKAKLSAVTKTNLELKHDMETVTNQREFLQQQLKVKDGQLLTAQLEADETRQQLESERSIVAQLRERCSHLKDEIEEKQAQDSVIRTSTSDVSLMSEIQESFVSSPFGDYNQVAEERDKLLEKNSQLSYELSSAENELQRVEEQLMTVVRQKLELTKQLEEWQCDMTVLVEQQVAKELYKDARSNQFFHVR